jgi:hypothetical protein
MQVTSQKGREKLRVKTDGTTRRRRRRRRRKKGGRKRDELTCDY